MYLFNSTICEITDVIERLKPKHTCGIDEISNLFLVKSRYVLAPYLTYLTNLSFCSGMFPQSLKYARVLPLHKPDSRIIMSNYRPISLLSSCSKVIEKIMHSRFYKYLEKFELLYHRQFGFREKFATVDALAELTERLRLGVDKNIKCSFFIDLKKAFDTLDHKILLRKLECSGVRGNCYKWFESYLSNRYQCVHVTNCSSDWLQVNTGIPQGSVLGPLLFLVYINDIQHAVCNSDVFLFADDTNISCQTSIYEEYQLDLTKISSWLCSNKLTLNSDESTLINFTKDRSASNLSFDILDFTFQPKPFCTYLGVIVDDKLKFFHHIQNVQSKLCRHCGVISKMRHYVPRSILLTYYMSNNKPIIQYGRTSFSFSNPILKIFGGTSFSFSNPILKMQRKIVRMICF